jgi:hypothetical protein
MTALTARLRGRVPYAFILALALAGYLDAPAWLALLGAAGLTLADWGLRGLPPSARMAWTSKIITYFATGVVANLILAALAFAAGRVMRLLLG